MTQTIEFLTELLSNKAYKHIEKTTLYDHGQIGVDCFRYDVIFTTNEKLTFDYYTPDRLLKDEFPGDLVITHISNKNGVGLDLNLRITDFRDETKLYDKLKSIMEHHDLISSTRKRLADKLTVASLDANTVQILKNLFQ